MKFRVKDLREWGVLDKTESLPPKETAWELPEGVSLAGPVSLTVHAEADDHGVVAFGNAGCEVRMSCSRCLEPFLKPLSGGFEAVLPMDQSIWDVGEEARQALLLALPAKPLCRQDCRGLCPGCGANRNSSACACGEKKGDSPFNALKGWAERHLTKERNHG